MAAAKNGLRTNASWNQFHRRDLGTRAGGLDSPPSQPPALHDDPTWPRFAGGAFFWTTGGDRADGNTFRWPIDALLIAPVKTFLFGSQPRNPPLPYPLPR